MDKYALGVVQNAGRITFQSGKFVKKLAMLCKRGKSVAAYVN